MEKEELLSLLEQRDFKRISDSIRFLWGNREFEDYMNKLIIDDRGDRAGFPPDVLGALLKLHRIHNAEFPFANTSDKFALNFSR